MDAIRVRKMSYRRLAAAAMLIAKPYAIVFERSGPFAEAIEAKGVGDDDDYSQTEASEVL